METNIAQRLVGKTIDFMSNSELASIPAGDQFVFDVECYKNFFYVAFKHLNSGKVVTFEQSPAAELYITKLNWMLWWFEIISFNGKNYDIPILSLALTGANCETLKIASDFIIKGSHRSYDVEREFKIKIFDYNHIDLVEVAPLKGSLKLYAARMHCETMQDLPIAEDKIVTEQEAEMLRFYCVEDLNKTEMLFRKLEPEIELRRNMSKEYGVDLRSKSDAQIAETVIVSELEKVLGYRPKKPNYNKSLRLKYNIPDFIEFESPQLNDVLQLVNELDFELDGNGSPKMPKKLKELEVKIGNTVYNLGMGGLHSKEKSVCYEADEHMRIAENDVVSYYPNIILNQGLFPEHLGEAFLKVYKYLVDTRIDAKGKASTLKSSDPDAAARFKRIANTLKIVINGSFGKLGNKFSTLYSPQLMLQVTLTGQLALLMLIEMLEREGLPCLSGNTDGVVSFYATTEHEKVRQIINLWEEKTNFETEETPYKAIYSRDVNNYIAIKEKCDPDSEFLDERLGCKTKGCYCERGSALTSVLSKNPEALICTNAVLEYLVNGVPVADTITNCKDIRRFLTVRNVNGGGVKNGIYLGKVVRWYYAKREFGNIEYKVSGNKVPKSDGGKPLMDLPKNFPQDVDYHRYIKIATEQLQLVGKLGQAK